MCVLALFYQDTGIHTEASEFRAFRGDASLLEEGNEWLVCGLNQHELERVTVERNALKRSKDSVEEGAPGD
jgi:cobyric acid synthase